MRLPVLIALISLLSMPLHAQADSARAVVEGRVVDPEGAPITGAEVVWQGDKRSVLTRADGSFSLSVPLRAETVVLVRRPGYSAQALRVDLATGIWRGTIVLTPGSLRLPDIEVAARYAKPAQYSGTTKYDDFFRRQKLGIGTFISREQIERMNVFHTIEILRDIPGIHVNVGIPGDPSTADIRIPRCESLDHKLGKVTVWIDGQMLIETSPLVADAGHFGVGSANLAEMLQRISPAGIEMVEVFRGPSQIPGEFNWDGCAAIAIWTRYNPGPDTTRTRRP
jgi:carboxypeptidase family protein/TonB-dependent receptor-like protein